MRDDRMIALAAAAEETSTHPLASAILNEVRNRGLKIPQHKEDVIKVARGIETYVNKDIIRVGSRRYMEENNISVEISTDVVKGMQNHGEIVIYVAKNGNLILSTNAANVSEKQFLEMIHKGLRSSGRRYRIAHQKKLPMDFPVAPHTPLSDYLKVIFIEMDFS